MKLILQREKFGTVNTKGKLGIYSDDASKILYSCATLELAWHDNLRNISCIPAGTYVIRQYISETLGACLAIFGVEGRTDIRIHAGNYANSVDLSLSDVTGCILVGDGYTETLGIPVIVFGTSQRTLETLLKILEGYQYWLEIKNAIV